MKRIKRQKAGFTLVELMIATTVFSVVLLLCTYGLLAVGRAYYKGLAISRTQENARAILADVAEALKYSPGEVILNVMTDPNNTDDSAYCIGTKRYSFRQYKEMGEGQHVLVSDTVPSCSNDVGAQSLDVPAESLTTSSRELLSPRMILIDFEIMNKGNDLYEARVSIATGRLERDDIDFESYTDSGGTERVGCKNERGISTFCTITELSTTVHRRV